MMEGTIHIILCFGFFVISLIVIVISPTYFSYHGAARKSSSLSASFGLFGVWLLNASSSEYIRFHCLLCGN